MTWDAERWEYWNPEKLKCQCGCGLMEMSPTFLDRMTRLRRAVGHRLYETSGSRCGPHDRRVSTSSEAGRGPHTREASLEDKFTHAMDFGLEHGGLTAWEILPLLKALGFQGIGIKMKGPHAGRFLHLDDLPRADFRARPTVWTY